MHLKGSLKKQLLSYYVSNSNMLHWIFFHHGLVKSIKTSRHTSLRLPGLLFFLSLFWFIISLHNCLFIVFYLPCNYCLSLLLERNKMIWLIEYRKRGRMILRHEWQKQATSMPLLNSSPYIQNHEYSFKFLLESQDNFYSTVNMSVYERDRSTRHYHHNLQLPTYFIINIIIISSGNDRTSATAAASWTSTSSAAGAAVPRISYNSICICCCKCRSIRFSSSGRKLLNTCHA